MTGEPGPTLGAVHCGECGELAGPPDYACTCTRRQRIAELLAEHGDWPFYVTEDGLVYCTQGSACPPDSPGYFHGDRWCPSEAGRHGTLDQLLAALARHVDVDHG